MKNSRLNLHWSKRSLICVCVCDHVCVCDVTQTPDDSTHPVVLMEGGRGLQVGVTCQLLGGIGQEASGYLADLLTATHTHTHSFNWVCVKRRNIWLWWQTFVQSHTHTHRCPCTSSNIKQHLKPCSPSPSGLPSDPCSEPIAPPCPSDSPHPAPYPWRHTKHTSWAFHAGRFRSMTATKYNHSRTAME